MGRHYAARFAFCLTRFGKPHRFAPAGLRPSGWWRVISIAAPPPPAESAVRPGAVTARSKRRAVITLQRKVACLRAVGRLTRTGLRSNLPRAPFELPTFSRMEPACAEPRARPPYSSQMRSPQSHSNIRMVSAVSGKNTVRINLILSLQVAQTLTELLSKCPNFSALNNSISAPPVLQGTWATWVYLVNPGCQVFPRG